MSVELKDIIKEENIVYKKTPVLTDNVMHYCPGCSHGVVHKLVAEVIEEMGIQDKTIGVSPVGCSVLAYNYLDIDWAEAAHGRAPAVATGISRVHPDRYVFTYQGDGDLASIGTCEIVHAAARGEKITTIFIYRMRRNHACVQPWREHRGYLYQQRHLRYDRGTNGPDYPSGTGHRYHSLRT